MVFGQRQVVVGHFFEQVAHTVFGGELCRNDDGDICIWKTGTTIEVKSSYLQSSYGIRCDLDQMEKYKRRLPFPFSHAYYVFFGYDNPRNKSTKSNTMAVHKTESAISKYLAKSVRWCLVFDYSIVRRWKEVIETSDRSILGHKGTLSVDLKWQELLVYANGGLGHKLRLLGLDPEDYTVLSGQTQIRKEFDLFGRKPVSFEIKVVLPRKDASKFQKRMKRRGVALSASRPA